MFYNFTQIITWAWAPYAITIDTKYLLLICLYKTSDEGVYRKAKKNAWNYRSLRADSH